MPMNIFLSRLCFLIMSWVLGAVGQIGAQNRPTLALTIIPTTYSHRLSPEPTISFGERPHFHVLLTNTSAEPVTLFEEWNSWGYYGLSFEMTYTDGRKVQVSRAPRGWDKNFPSTITLAPQGYYVFEVSFDKTWQHSVRTEPYTGQGIACRMRAIYSISPTTEQDLAHPILGRDVHPWAGTVASEEKPYTIWP
jgi:hypothetical protein